MKVEVISDQAKRTVVHLLIESQKNENGFVINYPRVIEQLENMDKIFDERLIRNLRILGTESLKHYDDINKLIKKLGGEAQANFEVIERIHDVGEILKEQLESEKSVLSLYSKIILVIKNNKIKMDAEIFDGRLVSKRDGLPRDIIKADYITAVVQRISKDEQKHIIICEDAINTLEMYKKETK